MGGKSRVAAMRDVTYEWVVLREGREAGTARMHLKATGALRTDFLLADGEWDAATNPRSAWLRRDGRLRTLTDRRLSPHGSRRMWTSRLADYKKQKVLARTVEREEVAGTPAYVVEFSRRNGARLRYWFGVDRKLPCKSQTRRANAHPLQGLPRARTASGRTAPHRDRAGDAAPLALTLKAALQHGAGRRAFRAAERRVSECLGVATRRRAQSGATRPARQRLHFHAQGDAARVRRQG